MTTYQERFNYALEIQQLRTQINDLEAKLRKEQERDFSDPSRTFEVVLRVTTRASNWGSSGLNKDVVHAHFNEWLSEIAEVVNLVDEGDSVKVEKVNEVTTNDNYA